MPKRKQNKEKLISIRINYKQYIDRYKSYIRKMKLKRLHNKIRKKKEFDKFKKNICNKMKLFWQAPGWKSGKGKPDYLDHNPSATNVAVEISRNFDNSNLFDGRRKKGCNTGNYFV